MKAGAEPDRDGICEVVLGVIECSVTMVSERRGPRGFLRAVCCGMENAELCMIPSSRIDTLGLWTPCFWIDAIATVS